MNLQHTTPTSSPWLQSCCPNTWWLHSTSEDSPPLHETSSSTISPDACPKFAEFLAIAWVLCCKRKIFNVILMWVYFINDTFYEDNLACQRTKNTYLLYHILLNLSFFKTDLWYMEASFCSYRTCTSVICAIFAMNSPNSSIELNHTIMHHKHEIY